MLFYNDKKNKEEILQESKELEDYRNSYSKKIELSNLYKYNMNIFKNGLNKEEIENKIRIFQEQINIINYNLELVQEWTKEAEKNEYIKIDKDILYNYTQDYKQIKKNYISNSIYEEKITADYIDGLMNELAITNKKKKERNTFKIDIDEIIKDINTNIVKINSTDEKNLLDIGENNTNNSNSNVDSVKTSDTTEEDNKLKNNDTLLISENIGKVILPYTVEEVLEIFDNDKDKYSSPEDVIENVFTRDLSDYKVQFISRYKETMKLAREKENYNFFDSLTLATEMMKIRFLHPAIISACKSITELDVYLDCLEKNELEDFRIFNIKYELYPVLSNNKDNVYKNTNKDKRKRGKRYVNDSKIQMWSNFRNKSR